MADDDLITDDELYEHYSVKAGKGQEPLRVDKFLMNFVPLEIRYNRRLRTAIYLSME